MLIYIIRHGETRMNVEGRLQGHIDEPLNENGRELARITGEALSDIPFDVIFTSPLIRAKETGILAAQASARKQGREIPVIEDDRLMEIDWGSWDGSGCTDANYSVPTPKEKYSAFIYDPFHFEQAPDGESIRQVIDRTGSFYQELIHNPDYQDKTVLIATHGCALRALLNPLYADSTDFWHGHVPYNCAVNILKVEDGISTFIEEDAIYYDKSLCFDRYHISGGGQTQDGKTVGTEEQAQYNKAPETKKQNGIDLGQSAPEQVGRKKKERGENMNILFVEYPKCTTCKKAKKWLTDHEVSFDDRHIVEENPTAEELRLWHERSGLPLKRFFNTSGQLYRQNNIKDKLASMTEEEQYELLASNGMLVKRPIIVSDEYVLVGFKEKEYAEKL